jgi:hypothetical protein
MNKDERPINLLLAGQGLMQEGTYTPEGVLCEGGIDLQEYIPNGTYCHGPRPKKGSLCPFWDRDEGREHQENGFCHLLNEGDWMMPGGWGLLWDQCKECGINDEWEDEDE